MNEYNFITDFHSTPVSGTVFLLKQTVMPVNGINKYMTTILKEGMREGDLCDLVLPLISVDEFQSKVDSEECLVFGFYVHDFDAAADLNRFLQKSAVPLIDTDISPAPDQHGYYIVFVELMNNSRLSENVVSLLSEIKGLTDIDDDGWQMRVRGVDELLSFSEDNLKDALKDAKKASKHEEVKEFFSTSTLTNVLFEGDLIIMENFSKRFVHEMITFGQTPTILQEQNLLDMPVHLNIRTIAKLSRLRSCLGEGWDINSLGKKYILIQNDNDPRGLLLKT